MSEMDDAFEAAVNLVNDIQPRLKDILTEEDAKLQLITRFVIEILGWKHQDISAERKNDNGYSDYILSDGAAAALVVEAKRQGEVAISSAATDKKQFLKISGPALKHALQGIEQAASYATPNGMQLAVLTDGVRWIFFKSFIPDVSYKAKEAVVFPSLEAVLNDFSMFYELGSKSAFRSRLFKIIFDQIHNNRLLLAEGLAAPFSDADIRPDHKSSMAFDLEKVLSQYFSQLAGTDDPDLIIDCFVETRESRVADFALEKITRNVLGNIAPPEDDVNEGLQTLIEEALTGEHGETVFIVGPAGAGKSTFLERFFKRTLSSNVRDQCVVIRINALSATGDATTGLSWFTRAAIAQIEQQVFPKGHPSFNELLGLFHLEYKKRAEGIDARLYERDKEAFKDKFQVYMQEQVEQNPEVYLRHLLKDVVDNRKRLPIFVVDNTDEFSMDYREAVFQFFQSLRRHVKHCLLLFPVTDRSAWSFSKAEIFNIYSSKSYFLPTPSPREVFRRRVDYLKKKIEEQKRGGKTKKEKGGYVVGAGVKLSIQDLEGFASTIENLFVNQDFMARRIGSIANYNIRKTLALCRRVITSSALDLVDLVKAFVGGHASNISPDKFMHGLLRGNYNLYKQADALYVFPLFRVDGEVRQSPLVHIRVLALLKATHDKSTDDDNRYMSVQSIVQYFDGMGLLDVAVERSLFALMTSGLVEPYDASDSSLSAAQRLSITHSGIAHLEMGLFSMAYFEEMALTTPIVNGEIAEDIRSIFLSPLPEGQRMRKIREKFSGYLVEEDLRLGVVPDGPQYYVQKAVTADIRKYSDGTSEVLLTERDEVGANARTGVLAVDVSGVVDWFDPQKAYGFVMIEELGERAFLHASVLRGAVVHDGDRMRCDISRSNKGLAVSNVYLPAADAEPTKVYPATVVKLFRERGYGFVFIPERKQDAFFHFSLLEDSIKERIREGGKMTVEINVGGGGKGLQVRRIVDAVWH